MNAEPLNQDVPDRFEALDWQSLAEGYPNAADRVSAMRPVKSEVHYLVGWMARVSEFVEKSDFKLAFLATLP